ncbi:DUF4190 domain-containing protein [Nocardioides sp. GY 10113]|nr:DUF4190 domain-containing protein [Nocardioides sp. GY 10113]
MRSPRRGRPVSYNQPPPPGNEPPGNEPPGTPPPGGYGAPPPDGYGAPPPDGYGTPPSGGYGTPPPPPPGGYGPPPGGYGAPPGFGGEPAKPSVMAISSLVTGILSIVCCLCWGLGGLLGIAAVVLGYLGRKEVAESGGAKTGGGLALAGLICGAVAIALSILFWVLVLVTGSFDANYTSDF